MNIAPHPDYGEGVWTAPEVKAEALALDPTQSTDALVASIMEILDRHGYDSIDRELAFWHYSQVTGRDYEEFYQSWLRS
jgi:hypothetical protein